MEGLVIFDHSSDIIFRKLNNALCEKIRRLAISQELISCDNDKNNESLNNNVLLQIFSPLINSQKIMLCQFDNTYWSIQCENDLNFIFDEFLGYTFIVIGSEPLHKLHQSIGIYISFAKNICGTNLYILKNDKLKSELLCKIIETWIILYNEDQATLLEAVEHLIINTDVKTVSAKTLEVVTEKLRQDSHSQRCHAIIFVDKKFFVQFSSRQAQKLSPCDILFLSILCKTLQFELKSSDSSAVTIQSNLFFLQGLLNMGKSSGCIPYIVYTSMVDENVVLILLIEHGNLQVSNNLYDTFFALQKVQNIQLQGDLENLKTAFENSELYVKQTLEALKKSKFSNIDLDVCIKKFNIKWDAIKKKYCEFFKNYEKELIVKIESSIPGLIDELKELFRLTCMEKDIVDYDFEKISQISALVEEKLLEFSEFLCVKAQRNLSINSYIEEFPGLVHFIFIDRSTGYIMAPELTNETPVIQKDKIWSMIELSRSHITKGHSSIMWKDSAFNYSYFLWFEDNNGTTMKPKDLQNYTSLSNKKPHYKPGILAGDFYQHLCEIYFPKSTGNKIKCYELYCIHLGLVTGTCALEHSRRLVATINDVMRNIPIQEM